LLFRPALLLQILMLAVVLDFLLEVLTADYGSQIVTSDQCFSPAIKFMASATTNVFNVNDNNP